MTWRGETKTIAEWAEITGIGYTTLRNRINSGIPVEKAMNKSRIVHRGRVLTFEGKTMSVHDWAKERGICFQVIYKRLKKGWPVWRALAKN